MNFCFIRFHFRGTHYSDKIVFNTQTPTNDLRGSLQGNVLFAQACIIPSKPATNPQDVRPHLVSLRDTLVMLKPINSDFNSSSGVVVRVMDENKTNLFQGEMLPPSKLPKAAERMNPDGDEYDFLEPSSYDYVIDSQYELNKIRLEGNSSYLKSILLNNTFIKIETRDERWIENFFLPPMMKPTGVVTMVTFMRYAGYGSAIHYADSRFCLSRGSKIAFTNANGVWNTIQHSSVNEEKTIREFVAQKSFGKTVNDKVEIEKMENDYNGTYIDSLITTFKNIEITIDNQNWVKNIYLSREINHHTGIFIKFSSKSKHDLFVHYDLGTLALSEDETLIFMSKNGKWIEWSDTLDSRFIYGENFWSIFLPKAVVKTGIEFHFSNQKTTGHLVNVTVGAPTELLLHTIDIGFLVSYRDEFNFQKYSGYQEEYFQSIPVSRIIVNEYEPVTLDEVVLPDGTHYTNVSNDNGGWHSGDMRQVGKALFSLGINLANYGIHSDSHTEDNPYSSAQIAAHNTRGMYSNGLQRHGGSGGNSMVTLDSSVGNEFSHEVGHNFGLGHYPGGFSGSVHRSSEYFGSTWGWDSSKNLFLPNFRKKVNEQPSCYTGTCQEPFYGHQFGYDAMAGGEPFSPNTNSYTLHTPYVFNKIQEFLESKIVFDTDSPTGMMKWDSSCSCMKPWESIVPWKAEKRVEPADCTSNKTLGEILQKHSRIDIWFWNGNWVRDIHIPDANATYEGKSIRVKQDTGWYSNLHIGKRQIKVSYGDVYYFIGRKDHWEEMSVLPPIPLDVNVDHPRKPVAQGIPVTTLLGYYDPEQKLKSHIYPALHSAYGNTFAHNTDKELDKDVCFAVIDNSKNESLKYELKSSRQTTNFMNKFHINVAETFGPRSITIYCKGNVIAVLEAIEQPTKKLEYKVYGRPMEVLIDTSSDASASSTRKQQKASATTTQNDLVRSPFTTYLLTNGITTNFLVRQNSTAMPISNKSTPIQNSIQLLSTLCLLQILVSF